VVAIRGRICRDLATRLHEFMKLAIDPVMIDPGCPVGAGGESFLRREARPGSATMDAKVDIVGEGERCRKAANPLGVAAAVDRCREASERSIQLPANSTVRPTVVGGVFKRTRPAAESKRGGRFVAKDSAEATKVPILANVGERRGEGVRGHFGWLTRGAGVWDVPGKLLMRRGVVTGL
jgi:hypothetical protein